MTYNDRTHPQDGYCTACLAPLCTGSQRRSDCGLVNPRPGHHNLTTTQTIHASCDDVQHLARDFLSDVPVPFR